MVVKKQGSYLKEDRGSGGIRSELGLIVGRLRHNFAPVCTFLHRNQIIVTEGIGEGGRGEDLRPSVCPSPPPEGVQGRN